MQDIWPLILISRILKATVPAKANKLSEQRPVE
jgi:hypothetical protein